MTDIVYYSGKDTHRLYIRGHAGFDSEGRDIVCSAVSALGWALVGFLENEAHDSSDYVHTTDEGFLFVAAEDSPAVAAAFRMALIGLLQIARKYPDHVRVTYKSAIGGDSREKTANN